MKLIYQKKQKIVYENLWFTKTGKKFKDISPIAIDNILRNANENCTIL
jgi:hypothetical protein